MVRGTKSGNIAWRAGGVVIDTPALYDFTAMLEQVSTLPGVQPVTSPYSTLEDLIGPFRRCRLCGPADPAGRRSVADGGGLAPD